MMEVPVSVVFQSTHPVRGATLLETFHCVRAAISIHAPREGCDQTVHDVSPGREISIHAPREGCDTIS